jgi:tyrosine-protein kinase Etk/Wzc
MEKQSEEVDGMRTGMDTGTSVAERQVKPATDNFAAPAIDDEISLLDLLIILVSRKRFIFLVSLICGILALLVSLLLPVRFTAKATLMPPQQQSNSLSALLSSQAGGLGALAGMAGQSLGLKNPNDMYVAMFKSETVEDAMIQRFGLMQEYKCHYLSDARKDFEAHFKVDDTTKDNLLHISVEDKSPTRAAEMANGYVDQFRKLSQTLAITEASQRRQFFEQQMEQAKDNLANAEEALKQTEQTTGLIQLDSQARALIESAATLRAQIAAKEVQLQAMRTYATNENSGVVEIQQELDSLRTQLAKLGGSEDNASSLIVPKGRVPEAGLEYVRRLRDVKYYETIFEILARQFELAKLDEAREGAVIQVVDPAIVPDRKSFPHKGLITIVATIAGFFIAIVLVLVQTGLNRMHQDPETHEKLILLRKSSGFRK